MIPRLSSRPAAGLVAAALLLPAASVLLGGPAAAVVTECSGKPHDINGDGFADVAIGEPDGGNPSGGRVHVLYGTATGLATSATGDAPDDQVFGQGIAPIGGVDSPGDGFGASTLVEDLTGDGCADVAIGVPGNASDRGAVVVLYGSVTGLRTDRSSFIEAKEALEGDNWRGMSFGLSLAAGDIDADGIDDLVVGAPFSQVEDDGIDRGAVSVIYGASGGFVGILGREVFDQNRGKVPDVGEDGDAFGFSVAAGDVTGDGIDDVVVGVPGENAAAGQVQVIPGMAGRDEPPLRRPAGPRWTQNTTGVPSTSERNDIFGYALALADVDGDGGHDIVVGAPGENADRGAVTTLFGDATGRVTAAGAQTRTQDSTGVEGVAAAGDLFGYSVAAGPLDADGFADVAVGTPSDELGSVVNAGSVTLLRGSSAGLSTAGYGGSRITQNTTDVPGTAERGDSLGRTVAVSPVQGLAVHNLLVAVPGEDIGALTNVGQSVTLTATPSGPSGTGSRALYAGSPGVAGAAEANSFWGVGLS